MLSYAWEDTIVGLTEIIPLIAPQLPEARILCFSHRESPRSVPMGGGTTADGVIADILFLSELLQGSPSGHCNVIA